MLIIFLLGVILSGIIIWKFSGMFETATEYLGAGLSDGVKGASLNAIASSMPELLTGFLFLFYLHGSDGYAGTIGTTAGSAVFNSLLIPSIVILAVTVFGIVKSVKVGKKVIFRDGFFLIIAEILLIVVINSNRIGYWEGLGLIGVYVVYVIYMFSTMRNKPSKLNVAIERRAMKITNTGAYTRLIFSTLVMSLACWLLVYCVTEIGEGMGIHLMFVSIILASAASSVPDTFISLRDALKGNYDDAVSNALGSNIFDICIAHGLPLAIYTFIYGDIVMTNSTTTHSVELRVWLLILTVITILIYLFNKKMGPLTGVLLAGLYGVFFVFVIARALDYEWAMILGNFLTSFRQDVVPL